MRHQTGPQWCSESGRHAPQKWRGPALSARPCPAAAWCSGPRQSGEQISRRPKPPARVPRTT
eukprot:8910679-Lingulodinium_polyedra.AAC.1